MRNFGEIFWQCFLLAAMAATLWLLTGCRTVEREVPVEVRTVVRDTVYVARTDTIGQPVYLTETRVERRSPWHWRVGLGLVGLAALIIWLVTARRRE